MSKKGDNPPPQPVQLPTDTYILSLNKKYAKVETNANNQLLYTLKNPIKLNTGDQVSLYKSYLNIRGLNSNTMTLDEDFDVDIKTGLFIPASLKRNADLGNDFYNYQNWEEYFQVPDPQGVVIPYVSGEYKLDQAKAQNVMDGKYSFATQGDFNSPYVGVQIDQVKGDGGVGVQIIYKPVSVVANFKVSAGQYDVNALALEITNQLNGSQLTDAENQNIIYDGVSNSREFDKIFNRGGTFTKQFPIGFYGVGRSEDVKDASLSNYTQGKPIKASSSGGSGIAFLDLEKAAEIVEEIKAYLAGDRSKTATQILQSDRDSDGFSIGEVSNGDNVLLPKRISVNDNGVMGYTSSVNPSAKLKDVRYEKFDSAATYTVNPIPITGDEDLVIGWGTQKYRRTGGGDPDKDIDLYGWNNLFQDYWYEVISKHGFIPFDVPENELAKPPQFRNEESRTYGTKSFNLVFNNENRFAFNNCSEPFRIASITGDVGGTQTPASAIGNQASKFNFNVSNSYPQEASSGNFILSFDNKLLQQTQKYKDLLAEQAKHQDDTAEYWLYEWALTMLPHDYFYDTIDEGAEAWENSLWVRLGFSYEELGNITPQQEKFNTPFANPSTKQSSMLGFMTHNSYGSALQIGMSGLGDSYTQDNKGSATIETFDEVGIMTQDTPPDNFTFDLTSVSSYITEYTKLISTPSYVYILATSQYFNASTLPDLSDGKNYFLVETDLIPSNYLDESNSQRAILGFVDKEFSSNDTIFSSTAIPFTMKQSKIVNTVMVNILNADGTKPIDTVLGNSSAFLIMVQRNSNAIFNYLQDEEIDLVAEEGTRPTTQTMTE